jgi:protein-disulfide isomerase
LFKLNGQLDNATLIKTAVRLGINEGQFTNCLYSEKKAGIVQKDIAAGQGKGVNGTPTFFVNGEKVEGTALSEILNNLKAKIQQKISEVQ